MIKTKLTHLLITKDAEGLLEASLRSSKGLVDEIIIVDDYSSDKTAEIAKKFKAKIYRHHEYDFGKQRAYGLNKASGDWVLVLDSDEVLSDGLKREINKAFFARPIWQKSIIVSAGVMMNFLLSVVIVSFLFIFLLFLVTAQQ